VLDADVVVTAMRSPAGASAAILGAIRLGQATLLLSVPLALEYEAVCQKDDHRLAASLTEAQVNAFVNTVIALAEPVETHFLWRPQLRDANDEMVLEAAVNGHAEALVTFNVKDYGEVPSRFGVNVMLPRTAIRRIKQ